MEVGVQFLNPYISAPYKVQGATILWNKSNVKSIGSSLALHMLIIEKIALWVDGTLALTELCDITIAVRVTPR